MILLDTNVCIRILRGRKDAAGRDAESNVRDVLGLPATLRVLSILAVGHKGMERKPFNEDRLLWDKVHFHSPLIPFDIN